MAWVAGGQEVVVVVVQLDAKVRTRAVEIEKEIVGAELIVLVSSVGVLVLAEQQAIAPPRLALVLLPLLVRL